MEDIALRQIASFTGLTDVFLNETVKNKNNATGFTHSPASFEVKLHNGSTVNSLNSVPDNVRGKRSNLNFYDESGFTSDEMFEASEPFTTQDSDFRLGGSTDATLLPKQLPNQLLYASSASSTDTYFFRKYRDFSKKMFAGDSRYFVADIDSDAVIKATFNGKLFPVPLLSQETVDTAMRENKEKAMREYGNIFTNEGSDQQIIKRRMVIRNSELRPPTLANVGNKKYVIAIDPARTLDNSVMTIAELYKDKDTGYNMRIVNCVSFVEQATKRKTPKKTPDQVEEFKRALLDYNGKNAADYENIEQVLIDGGTGGGGKNAWADYLLDNWVDEQGVERKGLIDSEDDDYKVYRDRYPNASEKLTLTVAKNRNEFFDALRDMISHDLIKFTEDYDGKGQLVFIEEKSEDVADTRVYNLSDDEALALVNIDRAKEELYNIYEFPTASSVRYELAPHMRNRMHDDRAYTIAMLAWYLRNLRRKDRVKQEPDFNLDDYNFFMSSGF